MSDEPTIEPGLPADDQLGDPQWAEIPELPALMEPAEPGDSALLNPQMIPVDEPVPELPVDAPIADGGEAPPEAQAPQAAPEEPAPAPRLPYAGEILNRLNCHETLPVFDDNIIKNLGSIAMSNFESDELEVIRRGIYGRVFSQQPRRAQMVKSGVKHPYTKVDMGNQQTVLLTQEELHSINNVTSYTRSLRVGFGHKIFDTDEWTNLPSNGDLKIAITGNDPTKSNDPIMRIKGKLGLSTEGNAVLWHTGMHMTLEGPGVLEQLRLETKLSDEKIESARGSNGLVYSASSVYLNRAVADFVLGCVTKTTIGTVNPEELKKVILITDLEPMTQAAAATIYPDGYNLDRPCLTDFGGCGETLTRKVNLRRMLFVRRSRITNDQFALMAKRAGRVDVRTVRGYQDSMRPEVSRYIDIGAGLKVKMRVPTIANYERQASAWMDELDNRSREVMVSYASEDDRQSFMVRANNIAMVMAYSSWIEAVVEEDPESPNGLKTILSRVLPEDEAEDLEKQYQADMDLDKLLESFADDGELTTKIANGIEKFINDMTLATCAIPKSHCPSCGVPLTGDSLSKHPHLVSINPLEVFFTLIHHRIQQAGG